MRKSRWWLPAIALVLAARLTPFAASGTYIRPEPSGSSPTSR
jgi:hypothetical protein